MKKNELLEKFQPNNLPADQVFVPLSFVIKQVEQLEEGGELDDDQINIIAEEVASSINNHGDLVSDYELSMSYREVELDSVEFDESGIERIVKDVIKATLQK